MRLVTLTFATSYFHPAQMSFANDPYIGVRADWEHDPATQLVAHL